MSTGTLVALTAVSAGMSIVQGVQQNAAKTQAGVEYFRQAQIASRENELAIQQKRREIDKTAALQVMAMAKNGMDTGRGTPLEILHETAVLGQQEVDALRLSGQAQAGYYNAMGKKELNEGRSALLGGYASALSTIASTGLKMSENNLKIGNGTKKSNNTSTGVKTGIEYGYKGNLSGLA